MTMQKVFNAIDIKLQPVDINETQNEENFNTYSEGKPPVSESAPQTKGN